MTVTCPRCQTRYRVDAARVGPAGAWLRCRRCQASVPVDPPSGAAERRPARCGPVLLALTDPDLAKATAGRLGAFGLEVRLEDDGVEAILEIQRRWPGAVVLDARIPSMSGFQICELMKRNESLRAIPLVLVVGPDVVAPPTPEPAPAADAMLEVRDLPEGLDGVLRELGLPVPETPRVDPAVGAPGSHGAPGSPAASDSALAAAREHAERLARIVISDIVLYNEARFTEAVGRENVVEAMAAELREGRALLEARVDPRVCGERDFLAEELLRVARERRRVI